MIDQRLPQPRITFVVDLHDLTRDDVPFAGEKAATLGELARAGFAVPEGFVLTTAAFARFLEANALESERDPHAVAAAPLPPAVADAVLAAAARFGNAALAVRSSGVAEDRPDASFAGQYETVLDVRGPQALLDAVRRCWASAFGERATAYRAGQHQAGASMAVLVQRLIQADAAGVAFTANPLSGNREETTVSAVRGLGERLVSGQASPDEWIVRGTEVVCQVAPEDALNADQVRAVAALARRVEAHVGGVPQDIEWAIAGSELFLLQARPITALPEHVAWQVPGPGGWARHFRIGEWLGDPVTPLFATWLLPRLDERFWLQNERLIGIPPRPQPPYALINGWFFTSVSMWTYSFVGTLWALARHPKALRLAALMSPSTARGAAEPFIREWREVALPRYRALVQTGAARVDGLPAADLVTLIDEVATAAGDYFFWLALVGGTGWKTEVPLARFYRQHLAPRIGGSHQRLLQGLPSALPAVSAHAVHSLDWFHPTFGESGTLPPGTDFAGRRAGLAVERRTAEAAVRTALANERKLLKEFERLLATAQHFAALREEVMSPFTMGWPLMRRALLRLGAQLCERGALATAEDVFFLIHNELLAVAVAKRVENLTANVAERRATWQRQRRLSPPLLLGDPPSAFVKGFLLQAEAIRSADPADGPGLRGLPASPGRASGPVRLIRGPDEFHSLQAGDVLVAPATAPAWTPLFARAAAVVTDSGSVLAHASLVAREFGIPAVVGTGDATARLRDGQLVTVDGSAGVVEV